MFVIQNAPLAPCFDSLAVDSKGVFQRPNLLEFDLGFCTEKLTARTTAYEVAETAEWVEIDYAGIRESPVCSWAVRTGS